MTIQLGPRSLEAPTAAPTPTRSRLVEAPAPADRLLAVLLELEAMTLVQTMTLRAGEAELTLIAGFGKLLEVVDARLPVAGWEYQPPRHRRQVARLLCTLIQQPEAIEISVQRGAAAWSRKAQGWTVGEIRSVCRRLLAAQGVGEPGSRVRDDQSTAVGSQSGATQGLTADDFIDAVASYCRAVLKLRPDGIPVLIRGEGEALALVGPQIRRDLAFWMHSAGQFLPRCQFILLRPTGNEACMGLLVEGAQTTLFVFDSPRTGFLSTAASRYLGGA